MFHMYMNFEVNAGVVKTHICQWKMWISTSTLLFKETLRGGEGVRYTKNIMQHWIHNLKKFLANETWFGARQRQLYPKIC